MSVTIDDFHSSVQVDAEPGEHAQPSSALSAEQLAELASAQRQLLRDLQRIRAEGFDD